MLRIMILGVFSLAVFISLLLVLFKQRFNLHHYLGMIFVAIAVMHAGIELWPFLELGPSPKEFFSVLFNADDLMTFSGTLALLTFVFVLGTSFLKNIAHSQWMIFHRATWIGFLFFAIHVYAVEAGKSETESYGFPLMLKIILICLLGGSFLIMYRLYKKHPHRLLLIVSLILIGSAAYTNSLAGPSSTITHSVTRAELEKHSTPENCWILIEGNVYDITQYISKHPTPDSVLTNLCGKDGTAGWKTKGRKNKSHSKKAEIMLKKLRVGPLTNPN